MDNQQQELFHGEEESAARALEKECVAVQMSYSGMGETRRVKGARIEEVAELYETKQDEFSVNKRLFKRGDLTEVTSAKGKIEAYVFSITNPYPLPGVRLLPRRRLTEFNARLEELIADYRMAVENLQRRMPQIVAARKKDLGKLFNEYDYPPDIRDLFNVMCTFPNVQPPNYLAALAPEVYEREQERVRQTFQNACELAESEMTKHFAEVVASLTEALSGVKSGERKCFTDATVKRVFDVLDIFKEKVQPFGIGEGGPLEQQVARLRRIIKNYDDPKLLASNLRQSERLSDEMLQNFQAMGKTLQSMVEVRPVRRRNLAVPQPTPQLEST